MRKSRFIELGKTRAKFVDGDRSDKYPKREEFVSFGVMFLNAESINTGGIKRDSVNYISESKFAQIKKGRISLGDTLLTTRGNGIGDVAFVDIDEPGLINAQMLIIRPDPTEFNPRYLYYYFSSPFMRSYVLNFASGSAQPQIPIRDLRKIPVVVVPIEAQSKIASILSAYDDLIKNNKRRIAILEKMAEEIYREWFVRMRFSSYAKATEDKPAIKVKGLPVGWRIGVVKDLGRVVTGKTPPTSEARYYGDRYPFIKTPDMHSSIFLTETGEQLSEEGFAFQKSQQIPARSICASCIGTAGVVGITTEPSQTNQQINSIVLKDDTHLEWAYFTILGLRELMNLFGATGATMTNISKGKFEKLPIILPPQRVIEDFHSLVAPLFDSILNLTRQVRALKTTRDLLLPRLISGKLSVENLELPSNEKLTAVSSALPQQELAHA